MSNASPYAVGDRVIVDPAVATARDAGVVYRVTRLLPVNVVVQPVDGGQPMKIRPSYLQPEPPPGGGAPAGGTAVGTVGYEPLLDAGALVTVAGPGWSQPPSQLYVVLRDTGSGRVSVVALGGAGGRYWRVSRRLVTVVDPARIRLDPPPAT
jgi:hypothetical protein